MNRPAVLKPFGPDIWIADGPAVVAAWGFHFPTRMAVIRLARGALIVWSPVALTDGLRAEIAALGEVRHLIAPNTLHHVFLGDWKRTFPQARVHAVPGLRTKRPDIAFDGDLDDTADPAWAGEIDQAIMANSIASEVVFFHVKSGTALFTDLLQQMPRGWYSGWRSMVARLDLMTAAEPSVPRKFRLATKRRTARIALERILAWPVQKVLMAHGTPVTTGAHAFLTRAFGWLTG